ncbi:MAG TPA: hypothetical protein VI306_21485 [Pyrinomonadaceae bacterium]
MSYLTRSKPAQNLMLSLIILFLVVMGCRVSPDPAPPSSGSTPSSFSFAVSVRDRYRENAPIGQATVLIEVGNETVAQAVTDDNGQANFTVSGNYLGKSARLWAKAHDYHAADLVLPLQDKMRQEIPLVSADAPKIDPDPIRPSPPPGVTPNPSPTPQESVPNLEVFGIGESKSGMIAEQQTIDFRFDADKNTPVIVSAQAEGSCRFDVQIFDSQGFPLKRVIVTSGSSAPDTLPFTPPKSGSYILRIKGMNNFGKYLVSMQRL